MSSHLYSICTLVTLITLRAVRWRQTVRLATIRTGQITRVVAIGGTKRGPAAGIGKIWSVIKLRIAVVGGVIVVINMHARHIFTSPVRRGVPPRRLPEG